MEINDYKVCYIDIEFQILNYLYRNDKRLYILGAGLYASPVKHPNLEKQVLRAPNFEL